MDDQQDRYVSNGIDFSSMVSQINLPMSEVFNVCQELIDFVVKNLFIVWGAGVPIGKSLSNCPQWV
jgi:hypothetical protein